MYCAMQKLNYVTLSLNWWRQTHVQGIVRYRVREGMIRAAIFHHYHFTDDNVKQQKQKLITNRTTDPKLCLVYSGQWFPLIRLDCLFVHRKEGTVIPVFLAQATSWYGIPPHPGTVGTWYCTWPTSLGTRDYSIPIVFWVRVCMVYL